jgi:hypothetical protein
VSASTQAIVTSWLARAPDGSSMLEDQLARRPLELDAIAGPIWRALGASGAPDHGGRGPGDPYATRRPGGYGTCAETPLVHVDAAAR